MTQTLKIVRSTLVILRRDDQILLALKKRGLGKGLWNGAGGKLEPGETSEQAMIREAEEEIGVTPTQYHKVAEHDFLLGATEPWHMLTDAYLCTEWQGEPNESEEMRPQWFSSSEIPYDMMWDDDIYWLPAVLGGKLLRTNFIFDIDDHMRQATITIVDSFEDA